VSDEVLPIPGLLRAVAERMCELPIFKSAGKRVFYPDQCSSLGGREEGVLSGPVQLIRRAGRQRGDAPAPCPLTLSLLDWESRTWAF
jgi:hypothetical protein